MTRLSPYAGYGLFAILALIINQMVFQYGEARPPDDDVLAMRAVGIFTFVSGYVTNVREMKSRIKGNLSGRL